MKITDQALFGQQVGPTTAPATTTYRPSPNASRPSQPVKSTAEREQEKEAFSVAMSVFRMQQSLCLFPLSDYHYKDSGAKLKHLLTERGLLAKGRESDLKQVLDELKRQSAIMVEALSKFP